MDHYRDDNINKRKKTHRELINEAKVEKEERHDTSPYCQKENFIGMDDIDMMRKNKIR